MDKQGKVKPNVHITNAQLIAIMEMCDTISGMIGVGSDFDTEGIRQVRMVDRFLKKNGYKRNFK